MKRAYERRQILARDGELTPPEVPPKAPRLPGDAPREPTPRGPASQADPRAAGLPWETLPLTGRVCRRCRAKVKQTWEGTRARRECMNGCFVATANYRTRQWEIEEPREGDANV